MREVLSEWYEKASVRSCPRRKLTNDLNVGKTVFPARLIPYLGHPALAEIETERRAALTIKSLYQYLEFTSHIETSLVNKAANHIATGLLPIQISDNTRLDALKIYTDEGYHSVFSLDLIGQIERATGIRRTGTAMTDAAKYDHRRQTVADTYLRDEAILADLLQAVIMETAITSILKEIPRDESIVTIVRQTIADHAHDEKYHHAYFTDLFIALWTALPPPKRHQVGQSVPHLMIAVLGPRKEQVESILGSININSDKVSQIINDIYTDEYIASGVRSTAKATIRLLSRVGVFDDPVILDSFRRAMLI